MDAVRKSANVSGDEFKICWAFVAPRMSDGDLFNMFKRAGFGQRNRRIDGKVNFVKEIMRRFQVMGGPVRLSRMHASNVCLSFACTFTCISLSWAWIVAYSSKILSQYLWLCNFVYITLLHVDDEHTHAVFRSCCPHLFVIIAHYRFTIHQRSNLYSPSH